MKKDTKNRALCLICCFSLTLGVFAYNAPQANAVLTESALFGSSIGAASLAGTSASFAFTGMGAAAAGTVVAGLYDEFIDYTGLDYYSGADFAESLTGGAKMLKTGAIALSSATGKLLGQFVDWFQTVKVGSSERVIVHTASQAYTVSNEVVDIGYYVQGSRDFTHYGSLFESGEVFTLTNGFNMEVRFVSNGNVTIDFHVTDGETGTSFIISTGTDYTGYYWSPVVHYGTDGLIRILALIVDATGVGVRTVGSLCDVEKASTDEYVNAYYDLISNSTFESVVATPFAETMTVPQDITETQALIFNPSIEGLSEMTITDAGTAIMDGVIAGDVATVFTVEEVAELEYADTSTNTGGIAVPGSDASILDWTKYIAQNIASFPSVIAERVASIMDWTKEIAQNVAAIPQAIADAIAAIFVPDSSLITEITDAFGSKFGFVGIVKQLGDDLLGMTADTEPPAVWLHLEDAEGNVKYGDAVLALDLTWYSRYKAEVDRILGGFLWLAFLWLLFKRVPDILAGAGLIETQLHDIHTIDPPDGLGKFTFRNRR